MNQSRNRLSRLTLVALGLGATVLLTGTALARDVSSAVDTVVERDVAMHVTVPGVGQVRSVIVKVIDIDAPSVGADVATVADVGGPAPGLEITRVAEVEVIDGVVDGVDPDVVDRAVDRAVNGITRFEISDIRFEVTGAVAVRGVPRVTEVGRRVNQAV